MLSKQLPLVVIRVKNRPSLCYVDELLLTSQMLSWAAGIRFLESTTLRSRLLSMSSKRRFLRRLGVAELESYAKLERDAL